MKKLIFLLFTLVGCTNENDSYRALDSAGYTQIHLGNYDSFMCGEGDTYSTHFHAKNPSGKFVEGTVCCGWMKGCTIRF